MTGRAVIGSRTPKDVSRSPSRTLHTPNQRSAMARKFFCICVGMFLLALAYHFGSASAEAQAPSNPLVGGFQGNFGFPGVVTANGDVYLQLQSGAWVFGSNVFTGSSVSSTNNPIV